MTAIQIKLDLQPTFTDSSLDEGFTTATVELEIDYIESGDEGERWERTASATVASRKFPWEPGVWQNHQKADEEARQWVLEGLAHLLGSCLNKG